MKRCERIKWVDLMRGIVFPYFLGRHGVVSTYTLQQNSEILLSSIYFFT